MSQKRGISTTIAGVAIVVALIIGATGGYFLAPPKTEDATTPALSGEIPIGVPIPLTGSLGTYGENGKVALELAVSEINTLLNTTGAGYWLRLYFEDTETKPDICLQKVQSLAAKGCKVMIGFYSSAEVRNCKTYADTNKILLISPSSTAPDLAIAGDYIFRFCPADDKQGPAIAKALISMGIEYIIPIWRGDTYGDGLVNATQVRFAALGGSYDAAGIRYDQNAREFSTEIALLAQKVQQAVDTYGADKVAVYTITFEEIVAMMVKANEYPILSSVTWFGCDGSALSAQLSADPVAAAFAVQTIFPASYFAPAESANLIKVREYIQTRLGRTPDPYAYNLYDTLWIVWKCIGAAGKYDGEAVKTLMIPMAGNTFGASGWCQLSLAGDRTIADYEFWGVYQVNATAFDWKKVGFYSAPSDSVTWTW